MLIIQCSQCFIITLLTIRPLPYKVCLHHAVFILFCFSATNPLSSYFSIDMLVSKMAKWHLKFQLNVERDGGRQEWAVLTNPERREISSRSLPLRFSLSSAFKLDFQQINIFKVNIAHQQYSFFAITYRKHNLMKFWHTVKRSKRVAHHQRT